MDAYGRAEIDILQTEVLGLLLHEYPGRTVRSVLLFAEIRAVISLKWPVLRPYYVTIRSPYTVAFRYTAVGNRISTVHGRKTGHFNDITARISA